MRGSICGSGNTILYSFQTLQVVIKVLNISSLYGTDMHMGFYSASLLCTNTSTHKCTRTRAHTHTQNNTYQIYYWNATLQH